MQPKKQLTKALIIGVAVVGVIGGAKFLQIRAQMAAGGFMPPPEAVTAMVVSEISWPKTLAFVGNVRAVRGAVFSAEAAGRVLTVNENRGQVKVGEVLVALDTALEEARLLAAEANEKKARAAFERAVSLKATNSISQALYDQTSAEYSAAKADTKAWQAEINKKRVVAPFDGTTGVPKVNVGEYVNPGQALIPLYDTTSIYADFALPQQEISRISVGQRVVVRGQGREENFVVRAIDPNIDPQTRTAGVRATPSAKSAFVAGEYVEGVVVIDESATRIALPTSAISFAPYGDAVFVVTAKDGAQVVDMTPVTLGEMRGNLVEILSGLSSGAKVVTSGVFKLRPGAQVLIDDKANPAEQTSPDIQRS